MPKVKDLRSGRVLSANKGERLMDVLVRERIHVENPCSGMGTCGKCKVFIDEKEVLACQISVEEDMAITVPESMQKMDVLSDGYTPSFRKDENLSGYGVAIDIGTTTIAMSLVDLVTGRELAKEMAINVQRAYGQDVLTRITYELEHKEKGIRTLQVAVVDSLNQGIRAMCQHAKIEKEEIVAVSVAANCTMTHMLLGIDARSIGVAPYKPVFLSSQTRLAKEIGLQVNQQASLYCLPQVSGYIGGDIVAGGYVCGLEDKEKVSLFLDIGTNGEMILANKGMLFACSCAAGPALEGMNITCGMSAHSGAIESVMIEGEEICYKTIGNKPAIGICGSGILETVAMLLQNGFVKRTGAFVKSTSLMESDWRRKYLYQEEQIGIYLTQDRVVKVNQQDVRQVQLAKGAILSGFLSLVKQASLKIDDIEEVYIAGQFGSHLSAEALCNVGLIPKETKDKVLYVGNTSKTGAYIALLSEKARKEMEELAQKIQYYELAESDNYEQLFMECMRFPE